MFSTHTYTVVHPTVLAHLRALCRVLRPPARGHARLLECQNFQKGPAGTDSHEEEKNLRKKKLLSVVPCSTKNSTDSQKSGLYSAFPFCAGGVREHIL